MVILLDRKTLESALVKVPLAHGAMSMLPTLRVGHGEPSNECGQVAIVLRPEHEMPVITHQAPIQNPHGEPIGGFPEHTFKRLEILILFEQPQLSVGSV